MISNKTRLAIAFAALAAVISFAMKSPMRAKAAVESVAQAGADQAPRIKPEEVRELLKKSKAVLVDVRGSATYKAGHIKGALNIPYSEIVARSGELPRDKMIVTYCSWPSEHTSAGAVTNLKTKGITNAAAVLGGYDALVKAGFPTASGDWAFDKIADNQVTRYVT